MQKRGCQAVSKKSLLERALLPSPIPEPPTQSSACPSLPQCCLWEQGGHPNRAGFFQPQAWISLAKSTSICSLHRGQCWAALAAGSAQTCLRGCSVPAARESFPQHSRGEAAGPCTPPPQQHTGRPAFIYTNSRACSELRGRQSVPTETESSSSHPETRHKQSTG